MELNLYRFSDYVFHASGFRGHHTGIWNWTLWPKFVL